MYMYMYIYVYKSYCVKYLQCLFFSRENKERGGGIDSHSGTAISLEESRGNKKANVFPRNRIVGLLLSTMRMSVRMSEIFQETQHKF